MIDHYTDLDPNRNLGGLAVDRSGLVKISDPEITDRADDGQPGSSNRTYSVGSRAGSSWDESSMVRNGSNATEL